MSLTAYILVHPGSFISHRGSFDFEAILGEMAHRDGPVFVIDGFLSDVMAPFNAEIAQILANVAGKGYPAARLWGCDAGEKPYSGWPGYLSPGLDIPAVYGGQQKAAAAIAPTLAGMNVFLSGAWATRDDSSGCVNSVGQALENAGWTGRWDISDLSLFEEDEFENETE